ncbi:MAG: hypothetical protein EB082_10030, partial [Verrucomicrobia bacterium]|nr:hypothetical protein [Verrucomicrobiota bacterium]
MSTNTSLLLLWLAVLTATVPAQTFELSLSSPVDFQVIQRTTQAKGTITLAGQMTKRTDAILEARISADSKPGEWRKLAAAFTDNAFAAQLETAVGGWYRLEVRVVADGQTVGQVAVEHVGVGEVFVVAG